MRKFILFGLFALCSCGQQSQETISEANNRCNSSCSGTFQSCMKNAKKSADKQSNCRTKFQKCVHQCDAPTNK